MRGRVSIRGPIAGVLVAAAVAFTPTDASAVRFSLGLASALTPLVVDASEPDLAVRLGLRPVVDVEPIPWIAISAYAPFTLIRTGESLGSSSSGAESVFALGLSGRYRHVADTAPEETLWYATARGGFGTVEGRAGLYYGFALGMAMTWLQTGRGFFIEAESGHLGIAGGEGVHQREVDRWLVGLSIGVVFRLGGERWDI